MNYTKEKENVQRTSRKIHSYDQVNYWAMAGELFESFPQFKEFSYHFDVEVLWDMFKNKLKTLI